MHCMTNISSTDQTLRARRVYPCSFNAKVLSLCQFSQFCYMYFEVSHQTTTKRFRRKKKKNMLILGGTHNVKVKLAAIAY